ncbi:MAG: hypothetical protein F6K58_04800 [Symploca sp. SIO2E9]|nr:hypothetical protein [Symploca sp. SIO2E9]
MNFPTVSYLPPTLAVERGPPPRASFHQQQIALKRNIKSNTQQVLIPKN